MDRIGERQPDAAKEESLKRGGSGARASCGPHRVSQIGRRVSWM